MTMFMAHNGQIALGDPNAAEIDAWVAQLIDTLQLLDQADQNVRQSFMTLSAAAQQQGGLSRVVLDDYDALAVRLDTFNNNVLQFLRAGLPKLTGLPAQIRRSPRIGYTPTEDGAAISNLSWNTAGCGLGAAKTRAATEAVEWLGVKVFGKKVATAAAGASVVIATGGLTIGGVGWLLSRNEAAKISLDAGVQRNATGIFKDTYAACMAQSGDATQCQKAASDAYAAYVKGRVRADEPTNWGFFKWLGVLGLAGVSLVIFQRYRAGAFPFATRSGGGWNPSPAYAQLPAKADDDEG